MVKEVASKTSDVAGDGTTTATVLTQSIIVVVVAAPTAVFSVSPTPVVKNVAVNFNAAASTVAAGHAIVQYAWNFGDGTTASGSSTTHTFLAAGAYRYRSSSGEPEHWMTGIRRDCRGRGIATALKSAAIAAAREAGVPVLRAQNDLANAAMRRVNEKLGYRPRLEFVYLARPVGV